MRSTARAGRALMCISRAYATVPWRSASCESTDDERARSLPALMYAPESHSTLSPTTHGTLSEFALVQAAASVPITIACYDTLTRASEHRKLCQKCANPAFVIASTTVFV